MLSFHTITLEDRERLLPLLLEKNRGMEYTFGNLYVYRHIYDTKVAYHEDGAIILFGKSGVFLMPLGKIDLASIADELPCVQDGQLNFVCITDEDTEILKRSFAERNIKVTPQQDGEYVYRSRDLADLTGKKYHSKRNNCSKFERLCPNYSFETITADNIQEVISLNEAWYKEPGNSPEELQEDYACTTGCLSDYEKLGLKGALLRCSGKAVAWCCGEMNSEGVFCTHVEKALSLVEGDYAVINRDFARMLADEFEYINREDDAGDEGLKKAKMSYHPAYILNKNTVVIT